MYNGNSILVVAAVAGALGWGFAQVADMDAASTDRKWGRRLESVAESVGKTLPPRYATQEDMKKVGH